MEVLIKKCMMSISTEDINEINGPTEVCIGSHKKCSILEIYFIKKNKKKILLNKGDIIIRKHSLWHRGLKYFKKIDYFCHL